MTNRVFLLIRFVQTSALLGFACVTRDNNPIIGNRYPVPFNQPSWRSMMPEQESLIFRSHFTAILKDGRERARRRRAGTGR